MRAPHPICRVASISRRPSLRAPRCPPPTSPPICMCVCGVSTSASASAIEDLFENNTPGLHKTPAPPTRFETCACPRPPCRPTALRLYGSAICSVAALIGAKDRMSLGLGNLIGEEEEVLASGSHETVVAGGEVPPPHKQLPPRRLQPRLKERVHASSCVRAHGEAARPDLRPHLHDPPRRPRRPAEASLSRRRACSAASSSQQRWQLAATPSPSAGLAARA